MRFRRARPPLLLTVLLLTALVLWASTAAPVPAAAFTPAASAVFELPVPPPPIVLNPFRPPPHRYGAGHRGVDLAAAAGSPITAAGAGTVVFAGMVVDRPLVSIEHPSGLRTTYEPVEPSVRAGQRVQVGTVIGTLADGHPSCAPTDCLHWGARLPDDTYLDPLLLLAPIPVRLKPWE